MVRRKDGRRRNAGRRILSAAALLTMLICLTGPAAAKAASGEDALTDVRKLFSEQVNSGESGTQEEGVLQETERKKTGRNGTAEDPGDGQEPRNAEATDKRVFDDAGLFTSGEIAAMEEKIALLRQNRQIDAVIVTSRDVPANRSSSSEEQTRKWADDYYDQGGFGAGEDSAGFLYLIDMRNRVSYLSTAGVMIDYISDRRLEELLSDADPFLARGQYGRAAESVLDAAERMMRAGIEEGHFRYDEATGKRLTGLYNRLTRAETVIAAAAGLAVAVLLYAAVSARYGLTQETYHFNKMTQSGVKLTKDEKTFLRETVTRTRIPQGGGSGGGRSGGGGGGGSGVHFSGGGHSHGGGGHHF